ncbi:MAG: phytoene/squalene synthase family protein [Anaerolineales bacterium]|nr:phytoene/squalene synthase family protein [Anaerolineales bacterium]
MSTAYLSWEEQLLNKARVALMPQHTHPQTHDQTILTEAYEHAEGIIRCHSRTFHMASGLLPKNERRAARVLYAFCRISDNIVDKGLGDRGRALENWKRASLSDHPPADNPVPLAWADTRARYHIPRHYAEQLLEGVALDLTQTRYQTFDELAHYCYGVASTVGLMSMHIIGFESDEAIPYAIKLGVALQLTNILRDVAEDAALGRIYLPQEDLARFGVNGIADSPALRQLLRFEAVRARELFTHARELPAHVQPRTRPCLRALLGIYERLLDRIEARQYDVFTTRIRLSRTEKLAALSRAFMT